MTLNFVLDKTNKKENSHITCYNMIYINLYNIYTKIRKKIPRKFLYGKRTNNQ